MMKHPSSETAFTGVRFLCGNIFIAPMAGVRKNFQQSTAKWVAPIIPLQDRRSGICRSAVSASTDVFPMGMAAAQGLGIADQGYYRFPSGGQF